jgi:hypothetical protein
MSYFFFYKNGRNNISSFSLGERYTVLEFCFSYICPISVSDILTRIFHCCATVFAHLFLFVLSVIEGTLSSMVFMAFCLCWRMLLDGVHNLGRSLSSWSYSMGEVVFLIIAFSKHCSERRTKIKRDAL